MNDLSKIIEGAAEIADLQESFNKLYYIHENGMEPGLTTGWRGFDNYFMFPPFGQLNIVTGTPGSGKSEWLDSLALNMVSKHKWKIFIYSPENNPLTYHLKKLTEKISNRAFKGDYTGHKNVSRADIELTQKVMEQYFTFVNCQLKGASVEEIMNAIIIEAITKQVNMVIIDPWNKVTSGAPSGMNETKYIGKVLSKMQIMAREHNISLWIVAHPAKPKKLQDGGYAKVTMYDISDSANWYNMADNAFILHRTWEDKVDGGNMAEIRIAKIKNRDYGKCGEHKFEFIPRSSRYVDAGNSDEFRTPSF